MGYTHYFSTKKGRRLNPYLWKQAFVPLVRKIFALAEECGIELQQTCSEGITSYTPERLVPLATNTQVRFNGKESCEDFLLFLDTLLRNSSWFCKTNRLPYDTVVVAVLIAAEHVFGANFEWSSDGTDDDHAAGRALCDAAMQRLTFPRRKHKPLKLDV